MAQKWGIYQSELVTHENTHFNKVAFIDLNSTLIHHAVILY